MLVLTRKKFQKVVINGPVIISVVEIRGDKVRLGFDAEPTTTIDREEVAEAKRDTEEGRGERPKA